MAYYKDLRQYLDTLEARGKLVRIKRPINKDTQLHPLVRLQFRGLPEDDRKGFLFENVVDAKGKKYKSPVAVSVVAPSRAVYAIGMACEPDKINDKWLEAQLHPIEPKIVADGPVHEEVHKGPGLLEHGGLGEFPIPISTPGYDAGPYVTAPCWVTKDPETGVINAGTYRAQIKAPDRTGVCVTGRSHIAIHVAKARKKGIPLEAALVIGTAPNVSFVSTTRLPYEVNEFAFAGGISGEPLELVKCQTVDLEVPAHAEIVLEGEISTSEVEPEAPFGETFGYVGNRGLMPYFKIKCITHRKGAIWESFVSQLPPSESTKLRGIGRENTLLLHLHQDLKLTGVKDVCLPDIGSGGPSVVIRMKNADQDQVWRALEGTSDYFGIMHYPGGKLCVAVDEDIDLRDSEAVMWAILARMQPHRDLKVKQYPALSLMDQSIADHSQGRAAIPASVVESHMLINATRKWAYPPVSLPKKQFMEDALRIWKEEKLPALRLREPWWGDNFGIWSEEEEEAATLASKGEYYRVGEEAARGRQKVQ